MAQAQRRPKDPQGEPMVAFMARRLREVTGFRGGYRDIAAVIVSALTPGSLTTRSTAVSPAPWPPSKPDPRGAWEEPAKVDLTPGHGARVWA